MYRFSVTAGCACPFFIEIIEIIEMAIFGDIEFFLKKVAISPCFFHILEYK